MMELYFKLKMLPVVITIAIIFLVVCYSILKGIWDAKFKKNCYDCQFYKFHSTSSCGDGCRYKCSLKNREDYTTYNNKVHYEKCDKFEGKKIKE